ncbi:sodium-coupled monocarboxylate transporter 1-like [Periplaneta americana]|uniref:sodium-coupled monocarboxylate transporter 1-like n=1 Tax=Periplaneta americana TaxID=6978 RepID=UPI0037E83D28
MAFKNEDIVDYEGPVDNSTVVNAATLLFGWLDYSMFCSMLLISTIIGLYFGCFGSRQRTKDEYLLGNRNMSIFPIAMSLTASHISGTTLLGAPSEMYTFGTQYWLMCLSACIVCAVVAVAYMPVFYKLQLTSTYEYLQLRFNSAVRMVASFMFTLYQVLHTPVVLYVPALAFSQVSGVDLHMITPVVCAICIFYTTLGGLKAVVWTDTLQQIIMMGSSVVVVILGIIAVGGLDVMWQRNLEGDRIEFFNMDPNPFVRNTFWTVTIGMTFTWLTHCGVNQGMMQRFLALPNLSHARWALLIFCVGICWCKSVSCLTGLLIHAQYHDCDPLTTKTINRADQLLPYYVMDVASHIPGLPGLFVAGVFCAALSSMSTGLNTLSGTIYEDFLSRWIPTDKKSEACVNVIMKLTVCIVGFICIFLVFMIERMGNVIQASVTLSGITNGAMLGLFSLGMFFPWANTKGALVGGMSSLLVVGWLVIGTQKSISRGAIKFPYKPMSTEGCKDFNTTDSVLYSAATTTMVNLTEALSLSMPINSVENDLEIEEPFVLFRLSYLYLIVVGCFTVIVVGLPVSFLTGANDPSKMHPDLLSPVIHWMLPKDKKDQYEPVKPVLDSAKPER